MWRGHLRSGEHPRASVLTSVLNETNKRTTSRRCRLAHSPDATPTRMQAKQRIVGPCRRPETHVSDPARTHHLIPPFTPIRILNSTCYMRCGDKRAVAGVRLSIRVKIYCNAEADTGYASRVVRAVERSCRDGRSKLSNDV